MHKSPSLLLYFVVLAVTAGSAPAWAQSPQPSQASAHAESSAAGVPHHKKHKHHNRNFYGKHYDPWAHSKGSH